jgi:putative salt-induced outer membrane protein YdiY
VNQTEAKEAKEMKPFGMMLAIAVLAVLAAQNTVRADEVWLKNGDHIKGIVVTMAGEKLVFKTSYAGDISIAWSEISNLHTDAPVKVLFGDGTSAQGMILSGEDGKIGMKSKEMETPLTFRLAQVKGMNPPPPASPVTVSGHVNVGINVTQGNTDTRSYYGDGELVTRTVKNRFTLGGRYNRAKENGNTTINNQTGYIEYDHFLTHKWYLLANAAGTRDKFKDLNLRSSGGLGAGYQFFEMKTTNLSFELGVDYVNEDHIVGNDDSYSAGRWAVNFDHLLYKDFIQFFHNDVGLMSLEDTSKTSVQSQTGFRFKIYQGLNATAQLNLDWDNAPEPGIKKTDKTYLFTLGYQF